MRLTEGFINDIAEHSEEYVCMPLCADTVRLERDQTRGLTHMYNEEEATFDAPQIGSFFEVHREDGEYGVSLVGTARINRRNRNVTDTIIRMFNEGTLKFSFEIWASELYEEDGVIVVDANPGNKLTAMAIVSTPALPSAVAIGLAADVNVEAFRCKVWELIGREFKWDNYDLIFMGMDYSVVYFPEHGNMKRIGYRLNGNELRLTEVYEVEFKEVREGMSAEHQAGSASNVWTPTPTEVADEVNRVLNTDTVDRGEIDRNDTREEIREEIREDIREDREDRMDDRKDRIEERIDIREDIREDRREDEMGACGDERERAEIAQLKEQLASVQAKLAAYEKAEEDAKLAQKQEAAREYAEKEGLDLSAEAVKKAIEEVNYEALAAEVMAKAKAEKDGESGRIVAEMKLSPYGNMFEKAN